MKRYKFKISVTGIGNSETEAWRDATESLFSDYGESPEPSYQEVLCSECYEAIDFSHDNPVIVNDEAYHAECWDVIPEVL